MLPREELSALATSIRQLSRLLMTVHQALQEVRVSLGSFVRGGQVIGKTAMLIEHIK